MSGPAFLAVYPVGSRVQIHREDRERTAYVVEVTANPDPLDTAGDPLWDASARRLRPTAVHPDLLVTEPE